MGGTAELINLPLVKYTLNKKNVFAAFDLDLSKNTFITLKPVYDLYMKSLHFLEKTQQNYYEVRS